MSAREWKPGDVAVVTARWVIGEDHSTRRAYRDGGMWCDVSKRFREVADWEVTGVRPLVVIDWEDADQVGRLLASYLSAYDGCDTSPQPGELKCMRVALREFADPTDPTPRIEEPRGLYAAVEDRFGSQWVRLGNGPKPWMHNGSPSNRAEVPWASLDVVRVLSEGVPS